MLMNSKINLKNTILYLKTVSLQIERRNLFIITLAPSFFLENLIPDTDNANKYSFHPNIIVTKSLQLTC